MRKQDWENKLNDYLESMAGVQFEWGSSDCLIFASDCVKLLTGIDPMSKKKPSDPLTIRGEYSNMSQARELIKQFRKSTPDIMDVHFERKPVNFAKRGDVVYYKRAFGICSGRGLSFFKNKDVGLEIVKTTDCDIAWDI